MSLDSYVIPKLGVYAVKVKTNKFNKNGIANIGFRPTFNGQKLLLETNIFGIDKNLYNKVVGVSFKRFIRPERKFKNFEYLKKQIKLDIKQAKNKKCLKILCNFQKTAFSMKASLPTKEPEILKKWEKRKFLKNLEKF